MNDIQEAVRQRYGAIAEAIKNPTSASSCCGPTQCGCGDPISADLYSADETAGVGMDDATPVTADYKERDNSFTGKIVKVTVDVKPIGAAVKAQADAAKHEADVKAALSN